MPTLSFVIIQLFRKISKKKPVLILNDCCSFLIHNINGVGHAVILTYEFFDAGIIWRKK